MSETGYILSEIAELTNSQVEGDPNYRITEVDVLETAGPQAAAFLENPRYETAMRQSSAGAIFIQPSIQRDEGKNYLVTDTPSQAFQELVKLFCAAKQAPSAFTGIHPTAVVADDVSLGENVTLGPYVVVDRGASIGDNTTIMAQCSIGAEVSIGKGCTLHPSVTVRESCQLGDRVICQPGVVIGSCGYGYHTDKDGVHQKLDQLGIVVVEDDVEIGANSCIDRARFKETRIGKGSKLDNLVQIGHNCQIGPANLICGQTGLAGSVETGHHVVLAGQAAVSGHLKIAPGVIISGRGAVIKSIEEPGIYTGVPVTPHKEQMRAQLHLRRLHDYAKEIKDLTKRLEQLESTKEGAVKE